MLYRVIAIGLGFVLLGASPAQAQAPPALEITDFTPETVNYPRGAVVKLRNHVDTGLLEAWVVRHLDGAIVRKYPVQWVENRWTQYLEVTEPKNDRLPALVEGENVDVPFSLVFVTGDRVVELSREFTVRVTRPKGPKGWDTSVASLEAEPEWSSTRVAGGRFTAIKDNRLLVATRERDAAFTFKVDAETQVMRGRRPWLLRNLRTGDHVSVTYVAHEGQKVAKEVSVVPGERSLSVFAAQPHVVRATRPYFMSGARFQVGTVSGIERIRQAPQQQGEDLIIETKTPRRTMRWRVSEDTDVVSGGVKLSSGDRVSALQALPAKTEHVVAVGAKVLKGSPVTALRILLLHDLSVPR